MTELIVDLFRFLHFLGLAALLGGLLVQLASSFKEVNPPIIYGALVQLVTGIVLLLLTLADANHIKVTVKLILLVVVLVIALWRRNRPLSRPYYSALLLLTVANVAIAVFW
jgi:hypothetical protein